MPFITSASTARLQKVNGPTLVFTIFLFLFFVTEAEDKVSARMTTKTEQPVSVKVPCEKCFVGIRGVLFVKETTKAKRAKRETMDVSSSHDDWR